MGLQIVRHDWATLTFIREYYGQSYTEKIENLDTIIPSASGDEKLSELLFVAGEMQPHWKMIWQYFKG